MSKTLRVETENKSISISLNGSELANRIEEHLPFESRASTWGDEIYFATPVDYAGKETTTDISVGDVAYWPEGSSLAIFFGPTPMSDGDKPVPADAVEVVGSVSDGLEQLPDVDAGDPLSLSLK